MLILAVCLGILTAPTTCPCGRMRPEQLASGADGGASLQQGHGWEPCVSPANFSGLAEGKWGLTLQATDRAGLVRTTRCAWPGFACTNLRCMLCYAHAHVLLAP